MRHDRVCTDRSDDLDHFIRQSQIQRQGPRRLRTINGRGSSLLLLMNALYGISNCDEPVSGALGSLGLCHNQVEGIESCIPESTHTVNCSYSLASSHVVSSHFILSQGFAFPLFVPFSLFAN